MTTTAPPLTESITAEHPALACDDCIEGRIDVQLPGRITDLEPRYASAPCPECNDGYHEQTECHECNAEIVPTGQRCGVVVVKNRVRLVCLECVSFGAYRDGLTHWRDIAALGDFLQQVERGDVDAETVGCFAELADYNPEALRGQLRAAMPCPCGDRDWFDRGDTSTAGLKLARAVDLIQAAEETCSNPRRSLMPGHAQICRDLACAVIRGVIGGLEPIVPAATPRDWMAEARAIEAGAAIAPRREHIRELLDVLRGRDEAIDMLKRGRLAA